MHDKVIRLKQNALLRRRDSRFAKAMDCDRNNIQVKDIVMVNDGSSKTGEVRHIYRSWAFVHSKLLTTNGGFFVQRTRHLRLSGATKSGNAPGGFLGGGIGTTGGLGGAFAPQSPRISSPMHPASGADRSDHGGASPLRQGGSKLQSARCCAASCASVSSRLPSQISPRSDAAESCMFAVIAI